MTDECCSVLLSTHIQEEIEQHMDYVIQLEGGKVISEREV